MQKPYQTRELLKIKTVKHVLFVKLDKFKIIPKFFFSIVKIINLETRELPKIMSLKYVIK